MRILLTGAHGQLGSELLPLLAKIGEVVAVGRAECDFASAQAVRGLVAAVRPAVIVNPAAYTAVNDAEANRELAFAINGTAPGVLAEEAHKCGAMLLHYSTDYVFDGKKQGSYDEFDEPAPLNVYGASKLAGEHAVTAAGGRFLILRTSWVYGPGGNNFLQTVRRLAHEREELRIVDDQVGAPTSSLQLAQATARVVREWAMVPESEFRSGTYHCTAGGGISWCGFAQAIVDALRPKTTAEEDSNHAPECAETLRVKRILPITTAEYPTPAQRPLNSVLCNFKFERTFGFSIGSWEHGLADVIRELRRREAPQSPSNSKAGALVPPRQQQL